MKNVCKQISFITIVGTNNSRFATMFVIIALSFAALSLTGCNRGGARDNGARSDGEAALSELQQAIEAAQQMLDSGTTTPTPTQSATTPAPSSSGSARGGDANWKWTAVSDSAISSMDLLGIAYGVAGNAGIGRFVATGISIVSGGIAGYSAMVYSTDGITWTTATDNIIMPVAITYASGRFVAVGGNVIAYADW